MPMVAHAMPRCATKSLAHPFSPCSTASRPLHLNANVRVIKGSHWQLAQQLSSRHRPAVKLGQHRPLCIAQEQLSGSQHQLHDMSHSRVVQGAVHSSVSGRHRRRVVAAATFMDLMGQIMKDMVPAQFTGSSLEVDKVCYHPAGRQLLHKRPKRLLSRPGSASCDNVLLAYVLLSCKNFCNHCHAHLQLGALLHVASVSASRLTRCWQMLLLMMLLRVTTSSQTCCA